MSLPDSRIVFVHIPKTAGMSLYYALKDWAGTDKAVRFSHGSEQERQAFRQLTDEQIHSYRLISGHFSVLLFREKCGPRWSYVSVVRDPVERFVSMYRYVTTWTPHPDHASAQNLSIEDYFDWINQKPFSQNTQAKMLTGTDNPSAVFKAAEQFGLVGSLAHLDQFLFELARSIDSPVNIKHHNRSQSDFERSSVGGALEDRIRSFNCVDQSLYEWVTANGLVRSGSPGSVSNIPQISAAAASLAAPTKAMSGDASAPHIHPMTSPGGNSAAVMRKRKLILHIGLHKTGTTAIQALCTKNRDALLKQGILYPRAGCEHNGVVRAGHHTLPWSYFRDPTLDHAWAQLLDEIENSPARKIIISSEEFDVTGFRPHIPALAKRLDNYDVQVLVYLRRQDEFVQSFYGTQVVHHNETRSIDEFVKDPRTLLDYAELLAPWASSFGKDHLLVRVYEKQRLLNANVVDDFVALTGIAGRDHLAYPKPALNHGFPWQAVATMATMRRFGVSREVLGTLKHLIENLYKDTRPSYELLSPSKVRALLGGLSESNALVAREYLGMESGSLFGPPVVEDDELWVARHRGSFKGLHLLLKDVLGKLRAGRVPR